jgi:ATP-binding cassette, subfamily C, bacterial CydD
MKRKPALGHGILVLDTVGAALFAAALALAVSHLAQGAEPRRATIQHAATMLALSGLIRAGVLANAEAVATGAAQALVDRLRKTLRPHLLAGRLAAPLTAGASATIAVDHVEALRMRAQRFAPVRFAAVVSPLLVLAATAFASPVAAAILLFTFVFFVLVLILTGTAAARESDAQMSALTTLSGLLEDRLRQLPIIRHFGAEERIARQIGQSSHELSQRTLAVLRKAFLSSGALEFFAALAVALVAVYCGFSLLGLLPVAVPEDLTLGEAFFALAMAPEFYLPMRRLAAAYHEKQLGEAAERIIAPLQAEAEAPRPATVPFAGLAIEALTLRLGEREIGPLSFGVGVIGITALVGPTGSGKTSLLAAIAGQLVPANGRITVPGRDDGPAEQSIAWAAQRPLLLPGTLAENIALARPEAPPTDIAEAAAMAGLGPLLMRRGLELAIDPGGAGLSGGERRRIGIARAILAARPLILLDEPTADLDAAAADEIAALLERLARERALVIATHDSRLVTLAQQVVRL